MPFAHSGAHINHSPSAAPVSSARTLRWRDIDHSVAARISAPTIQAFQVLVRLIASPSYQGRMMTATPTTSLRTSCTRISSGSRRVVDAGCRPNSSIMPFLRSLYDLPAFYLRKLPESSLAAGGDAAETWNRGRSPRAEIAQSVEHRSEKPGVASSILALGTFREAPSRKGSGLFLPHQAALIERPPC